MDKKVILRRRKSSPSQENWIEIVLCRFGGAPARLHPWHTPGYAYAREIFSGTYLKHRK